VAAAADPAAQRTARGRSSVALAGGSTPRALYELLPERGAPWRERIAWDAWELFSGDERLVPPRDPASTVALAAPAPRRRGPRRLARIPADLRPAAVSPRPVRARRVSPRILRASAMATNGPAAPGRGADCRSLAVGQPAGGSYVDAGRRPGREPAAAPRGPP